MQRLADLLTILYRPRQTIRRILDQPGDRWSVEVVALAFICGSVNEMDIRALPQVLPGLKPLPILAVVVLSLVGGALLWVIALFILSWLATAVGRMLGGTSNAADVRTALGWAMTPVVWSIVYRIPFAVIEQRLPAGQTIDAREVVINLIAHGGCSLVVLFLGLQLLFAIWCIVLGCFTVAEAEQFELHKGFITVVVTIAFPLMAIAAAVFVSR